MPQANGSATALRRPGPDLATLRFPNGLHCPDCGPGSRVQGWGRPRGRRRYRCCQCRRTFNDRSGTPLAGLHTPEKWPAFCAGLLQGESVRAAARRLGIHPSTAFRWRHRFLAALRRQPPPTLGGIVEISELYFRPSVKGRRPRTRPPRRRGDPATRWGMVRAAAGVGVLWLRDRQGQAVGVVTGLGRPTPERLGAVLPTLLAPGSVLCPERLGPGPFPRFCRRHGFRYGGRPLRRRRDRTHAALLHADGAYAVRHRFQVWLERFRGVATRYLPHYLTWYAFLEHAPTFVPANAVQCLLLRILGRGILTCTPR